VPSNRRNFLKHLAAGACLFAEPYRTLAQSLRKKVKITDVKCMIVRGTWDWNLIKIETDAGISGIGEAYWGPGVKDLVLNQLKPLVIGEDPLNVDKLYHKMLLMSGGAGAIGGVTITAASGIEIALWDLAGRILQTPVCNLLGGRFRDRVRFYRTLQAPSNPKELSSWRDQAAEAKTNNKYGFTAFKFQGDNIPVSADPTYSEPGHDFYNKALTNRDINRIVTKMEAVRTELGPVIDFAIENHWKYDTSDAIILLNALEHIQPMWVEDPLPPENTDAMARLARATRTPICTGENLYGVHGFRTLIESQACAAPSVRSHRPMLRHPCVASASTNSQSGSTGGPTSLLTKARSGRMATSRLKISPAWALRSIPTSPRPIWPREKHGGDRQTLSDCIIAHITSQEAKPIYSDRSKSA
jgi:L-alanine-DL-glutamate epimerase-like enolase superfamily enzyme